MNDLLQMAQISYNICVYIMVIVLFFTELIKCRLSWIIDSVS